MLGVWTCEGGEVAPGGGPRIGGFEEEDVSRVSPAIVWGVDYGEISMFGGVWRRERNGMRRCGCALAALLG